MGSILFYSYNFVAARVNGTIFLDLHTQSISLLASIKYDYIALLTHILRLGKKLYIVFTSPYKAAIYY